MGELEVLVLELLAIDGLSASALFMQGQYSSLSSFFYSDCSYVAAGEVTTLEHELGDHAVELAAGIAEALLASAKSAEVLSGGGDGLLVEVEVDAAVALY